MKNRESQFEQNLQHHFDRLRNVAPLDAELVAQERANFLAHSATMRAALPRPPQPQPRRMLANLFGTQASRRLVLAKALIAILLGIAVLFGGAAATVYAAQDGMPGQPLYGLKTWSEGIRLTIADSPALQLKLNLQFTNRRMQEIAYLVENGLPLPEEVVNRLYNHLENVLHNAAELEDPALSEALAEIRLQAEIQAQALANLVQNAATADPTLEGVQARLQEQIRLATAGQTDPQEFKLQMQERLRLEQPTPFEPATASLSPAGSRSQYSEGTAQGTPTPLQNRTSQPSPEPTPTPVRNQYSTATRMPTTRPSATTQGTHAAGTTATSAGQQPGTSTPHASVTLLPGRTTVSPSTTTPSPHQGNEGGKITKTADPGSKKP